MWKEFVKFLLDYKEKWILVLLKPSKFFKKAKRERLYKHSIFFLLFSEIIMLLGTVILSLIITTVTLPMILLLPFILAVSLGLSFVSAGVLHLFSFVFKRDIKYKDTYKVVAYAYAPATFSWVPLLSLISAVWSLIIQIVGISKVHKISKFKASIVVLLPLFIMLTVLFFFLGPILTNTAAFPQIVF